MKTIFRVVIVLVAFTLSASRANVQSACPKDEPWGCYGSIEMGISSGNEAGVARITRFENGEILAETSGAKVGEQKLLVLRPFIKLYFGVPDKEIKEGFPFMFFEYAFAYPAMALRAAFPQGPSSISTAIRDKDVSFDGNECVLSVEPTSSTRIGYRLVVRGKTKLEMTGYWDTAKRPQLAEDHAITEWKSCTLKTYATVGAARRANDECRVDGRSEK